MDRKIGTIHQWVVGEKRSLCGDAKVSQKEFLLKGAEVFTPCEKCTERYINYFMLRYMRKPFTFSAMFPKQEQHAHISASVRRRVYLGVIR